MRCIVRYKVFGNTGLKVSELCLGTMTFGKGNGKGNGNGWHSAKEECGKVFDLFVEKGGNFFDTANIHTDGTSEKILGEFLEKTRNRHVLATKFAFSTNEKDPNAGGNHRKCLRESVEASLKRLQTDYIDILWVHVWDAYTPIEEMMRALDDLVRAGKVLYIGASDMPSWVVSRANTIAEHMGWTPFSALQLEYSLLERTIEQGFFDMAKTLRLAICPWSPLAMGMLTGKYLTATGEDTRFNFVEPWKKKYLIEKNQIAVKEVVSFAKKLNKTPSQVALRWIQQKNKRMIPILGVRTLQQLEDNLGCLDFSLTDEQMAYLDEMTEPAAVFPEAFIARPGVQEDLYGKSHSTIDSCR